MLMNDEVTLIRLCTIAGQALQICLVDTAHLNPELHIDDIKKREWRVAACSIYGSLIFDELGESLYDRKLRLNAANMHTVAGVIAEELIVSGNALAYMIAEPNLQHALALDLKIPSKDFIITTANY